MEEKDGISIMRVSGNSPLSRCIKMGDIIRKVNNVPVKTPDDLMRVIMTSESRLVLDVEN